jgi:valyl-tRNA synthetase
MKAVELAKAYDPKEFEDRIYRTWSENGYFSPDFDRAQYGLKTVDEPFVIVIPPPNVTGVLHMGHGLNNSLQDILIRYYRMLGHRTLWIPGTDHAGIATQNVVDRKLRSRGIDRYELGRERFVEETWKVKDEHHRIISEQLKKIGASCDWSRERFTLDEGLSEAVREVFVTLYEKDLIYRGNYLVNWCSSCGTALSDDEVEYHEVNGKLFHFYYPLADGSGRVEIATTRPETMLGDTALAVNPSDKRYRHLVGRSAVLPLVGREIPIVADDYVSKEFGTGVVKVTPAHDPNDREIGIRHNLEVVNILNPDGTLSDTVPEAYQGLKVREARKRVVEDLQAADLFKEEEAHAHQVGHCYRCDTVVEPYLSEQWFVKMQPLADKALEAWRRGEVRFYPSKWENTYVRWLEGIRDWCISRQLWWGHRIPVWYCGDSGEMIVSRTEPNGCPDGSTPIQDEDVLDTWFSSWLWPFSTLGWPGETADLKTYFPTSSLVTGYDIIFFWVARMIMAGLEFMGEVPFRDIYITGLVRDKKGRKMSKSLGNGIDPLEIVDEYGADAHKFTLAFLAAQGQDILLDKDDFAFGSRFANKIWNASRYILMNLEGRTLLPRSGIELTDVDRWILHRLNHAVEQTRDAMSVYRFNDASNAMYEFFWNDFCDWYLEASKLELYSDEESRKDRAISLLMYLLEESLRLLHPFMSFITEEIYAKLPEFPGDARRAPQVIVSDYPEMVSERRNETINRRFAELQELVRLVRTLRSEFSIPPSMEIALAVRAEPDFQGADFVRGQADLIRTLVKAAEISFVEARPERAGTVTLVGTGYEVYAFVRDVIDVGEETRKLKKDLEKNAKALAASERKLANSGFLEKADPSIIQKERDKHAELAAKVKKVERYLEELAG